MAKEITMVIIVLLTSIAGAMCSYANDDFVKFSIMSYANFACAGLQDLNGMAERSEILMQQGYVAGTQALARTDLNAFEMLGAPIEFMTGVQINTDFTLGMVAAEAQVSALQNHDARKGTVQIATTTGDLIEIECDRL